MSRLYLSNPCAFFVALFAHGDAGAVSARLSLRPLHRGSKRDAKPGRKRVAGMSAYVSAAPAMTEIGRVSARRFQPFFREQPHRGVRVHRLAEGKALRVLAAELVELDGVGI